jgi:hypothetical protein
MLVFQPVPAPYQFVTQVRRPLSAAAERLEPCILKHKP